MSESIRVPEWEYHNKNVQGSIPQQDFTRADRVIIYTAPTPRNGEGADSFKPIGLIQGMSHSENKQLQLFFELGSDAPMIIPGMTQGQISIQRVLLNGFNLLNAVYHGTDLGDIREDQILRSIRDINVPFDIMIAKYPVLDNSEQSAQATETTLFRGCQIASKSEQISAGGVVIMENLQIQYATIPKVTFRR